jgi:hypothetical protein
MIQPVELKQTLPIELRNGVYSTTTEIWNTLVASREGNVAGVKQLVSGCSELSRCEYNYTPPLHFAVREGHLELVRSLLEVGALDPSYRTYPYLDTLLGMARDREHREIARLLEERLADPDLAPPPEGGGVHGIGHIEYGKDEERLLFEKLAGTHGVAGLLANALTRVERMLHQRPELALDELAFWAEGILSVPANNPNRAMLELLIRHGARVPEVSKWAHAYYFKHYSIAVFLMENGMGPNHLNWHRTTLLHQMAWQGHVRKARLLLDHGADPNAVDEEYQSTPLAYAARWGHPDIVSLLLERGADPVKAGAPWATPLAWARKQGHAEIETALRQAGATA